MYLPGIHSLFLSEYASYNAHGGVTSMTAATRTKENLMRHHLDSVTRSLRRSGSIRGSVRVPRVFRPRSARSTFVPVSDVDLMRGLVH